MQGYHFKCSSADLLFSAADDDQGGHRNQELRIPLLAPVHDECTERKPVDCLWQSELTHLQPHLPCPALPCSALPPPDMLSFPTQHLHCHVLRTDVCLHGMSMVFVYKRQPCSASSTNAHDCLLYLCSC